MIQRPNLVDHFVDLRNEISGRCKGRVFDTATEDKFRTCHIDYRRWIGS